MRSLYLNIHLPNAKTNTVVSSQSTNYAPVVLVVTTPVREIREDPSPLLSMVGLISWVLSRGVLAVLATTIRESIQELHHI
ncbi:unnamed protein product [Oppiella nova]|uniref:Uncharacterized protein n=1 Tax=Oppiella nova TaxID=334625 RepID=A0A7R9R0K2_9ACAR|nr:unnamed protein product [Oppiella nova]CAG2181295.1 unnamed protein product [Oppiella nova]